MLVKDWTLPGSDIPDEIYQELREAVAERECLQRQMQSIVALGGN